MELMKFYRVRKIYLNIENMFLVFFRQLFVSFLHLSSGAKLAHRTSKKNTKRTVILKIILMQGFYLLKIELLDFLSDSSS